jgi:hypothetical protein
VRMAFNGIQPTNMGIIMGYLMINIKITNIVYIYICIYIMANYIFVYLGIYEFSG